MKIDFVLSMHFVDYGGFQRSLLIQHKYIQSNVSHVLRGRWKEITRHSLFGLKLLDIRTSHLSP